MANSIIFHGKEFKFNQRVDSNGAQVSTYRLNDLNTVCTMEFEDPSRNSWMYLTPITETYYAATLTELEKNTDDFYFNLHQRVTEVDTEFKDKLNGTILKPSAVFLEKKTHIQDCVNSHSIRSTPNIRCVVLDVYQGDAQSNNYKLFESFQKYDYRIFKLLILEEQRVFNLLMNKKTFGEFFVPMV